MNGLLEFDVGAGTRARLAGAAIFLQKLSVTSAHVRRRIARLLNDLKSLFRLRPCVSEGGQTDEGAVRTPLRNAGVPRCAPTLAGGCCCARAPRPIHIRARATPVPPMID